MNGGVERLGRPRREVSERLFGRRPWLCRVDDDLLIRLGVGGECIPVERDLADDGVVVNPRASSFQGDVCAGPPSAAMPISDRALAHDPRKTTVVALSRR